MPGKNKADEDRDFRSEAAARWREHPTAEVHDENLPGLTAGGDTKATQPELHAAAGVVYLNTHGETRLTREDLVTWRKRLDEAFQVVA